MTHRGASVRRHLARIPVKMQRHAANVILYVAFLAALFGAVAFGVFSETERTSGALWWRETTEVPLSERVPALVVGVVLVAVAATSVFAAVSLYLLRGSMQKYLAVLAGVESIQVQRIADITNTSRKRVYQDMQSMISSGMIEDYYLDHKADCVVSRQYIPKRSHKVVVACSGCHASNEIIVGIPKKCDYCRMTLAPRAV